MVDLTIEFASGTRKSLSDLTTSNGVTPLELAWKKLMLTPMELPLTLQSVVKPCHHSKHLLSHTQVLQRKRKNS